MESEFLAKKLTYTWSKASAIPEISGSITRKVAAEGTFPQPRQLGLTIEQNPTEDELTIQHLKRCQEQIPHNQKSLIQQIRILPLTPKTWHSKTKSERDYKINMF